MSFATLTVLNLSSFVCININQLSTINRCIPFQLLSWTNYSPRNTRQQITKAIESGYLCLMWWLVALSAPGHYLTQYKSIKTNFDEHWIKCVEFRFENAIKTLLAGLTVLNINSRICINITQLSTRKQDTIFKYCHQWITALGLQAFNSLRLSN